MKLVSRAITLKPKQPQTVGVPPMLEAEFDVPDEAERGTISAQTVQGPEGPPKMLITYAVLSEREKLEAAMAPQPLPRPQRN